MNLANPQPKTGAETGREVIARPDGLPTISVIMMMKNEAEALPRCLKSIGGLADEIVVVDTGSTDNSIEIAESFGAKVFIHPGDPGEKFNFSLHRNQSIEHASGEWLFQIDCDEQLFMKDPIAFRKFLKGIPPKQNGVAIQLFDQKDSQPMDFNAARVFRNGSVHFEEIVHNEPKFGNDAAWLYPGAFFKHFGYDLSPERMAAKYARTIGLLKRRILKKPDDYHAFFLLSQALAAKGETAEARKYAEKYLAAKEKDPAFNASIYYSIIQFCMATEDFEAANHWLGEAVREIPNDVDIAYIQVEFGVAVNNIQIIVDGGSRFLRNYQTLTTNPAAKGNRFVYNHRPEKLVFCLYYLTSVKMKEAIETFKMIMDILPKTSAEFRNETAAQLKSEYKKVFKGIKKGGDICHLILKNIKLNHGNQERKKSKFQN